MSPEAASFAADGSAPPGDSAYAPRSVAAVQPAGAGPAADQRTISVRRRHLGRWQCGPVPGSRARTGASRSPTTVALRPIPDEAEAPSDLAPALASLKPLGQIRDSFILAVNPEGLWIVDQHVAHERVLFEKILKQRAAQKVESQRLLLPLVIELTPAQQAVFTEISDELAKNGFEVEPFGARSIAVKIAPAGVELPRSSTCCTNCSTSFPARSRR